MIQELKTFDIACSVVDSIAMLDPYKSVQWEDLNQRDVLSRLQNNLSSYRGGNSGFADQITSRLARLQEQSRAFPETGEEQDIFRDCEGTRGQYNQSSSLLPSPQVGQSEHHDSDQNVGSFPSLGLYSYDGSPNFSQVDQSISFPWDPTPEETQAHYNGSLEQMGGSAAFDAFVNEAMGESSSMVARV